MFRRLREYNDRRRRIIEEEVAKVKEQLTKEFEERIAQVREEAYQQGYKAGAAESAPSAE